MFPYILRFKIIKVGEGWYVVEHLRAAYEEAIGPYSSEEEARKEELEKAEFLSMFPNEEFDPEST